MRYFFQLHVTFFCDKIKATTKEEEQEATNLIDKVNEKYNHKLKTKRGLNK